MLKATVAAAAFVASFAACSKVDDLLGLDFLPPDQNMVIRFDTITSGIDAYQVVTDSLLSVQQGFIMFGAHDQAGRGLIKASAVLQFAPYVDNEPLAADVVLDSLTMYLTLSRLVGDTVPTNVKSFFIYEVRPGKMIKDSAYYTSFDPNKPEYDLYDASKPLFKFNYNNTKTEIATLMFTETNSDAMILPEGKTYLQRLASISGEQISSTDTFHELFGGFYIAPEPTWPNAGNPGAVFVMPTGVDDNTGRPYSNMYLYAHKTTTEKTDTLFRGFFFRETASHTSGSTTVKTVYNVSVTSISHDYTGTPIQAAIDEGAAGISSTQVWLDSPAGATPKLKFTDGFVDRIKDYKTYNGKTYSALAVNRAEIIIPLKDKSVTYLNESAPRMGMYYNYHYGKWIPDYDPSYEAQYGALPYGGYLNRTKGEYSMDVTSYIQRLVLNAATQKEVFLGESSGLEFSNNFTTLDTGADKIRLVITYTLIE